MNRSIKVGRKKHKERKWTVKMTYEDESTKIKQERTDKKREHLPFFLLLEEKSLDYQIQED